MDPGFQLQHRRRAGGEAIHKVARLVSPFKRGSVMNVQTSKIFYCPDETGPAQLLGDRLARIVDPPLLADFSRDAIVRLSHNPVEGDKPPSITEVVWTPYDCLSRLHFDAELEADTLNAIFRLLGLDSWVLW